MPTTARQHRATNTPRSNSPWWQSRWLRPFNDRAAIGDIVRRVMPRAALDSIRARVEQVIEETSDTKSFVLHANRNWPGFRAGQHVLVTMEVRGRRLQRCFSISSAPGSDRRLTITVKRHTDSGVTAWMHQCLHAGTIVTLSPPFGAFCVPDPAPSRLLMLTAGSGITPIMAMLDALRAQQYCGDIVLLHSCRRRSDWIFAGRLRALAASWPTLKVLVQYSEHMGQLNAQRLAQLVPDHGDRHTLLCGPSAFAAWVRQLHQDQGRLEDLQSESFGLSTAKADLTAGVANPVACTISEHTFTAAAGQALLPAAEAAGLSPRHGCRIGICRSCLCQKRDGIVENLLTGEVSAEPGQWIQLCISTARSPLTLEL